MGRAGLSSSPFLSLKYKQFRYLWLGQLSTTTAQMMDMVTRGWLVYDLTGSAAHLAFVTAVRALPFLFFGVFVGVLADRFDRRILLLLSQYLNLAMNLVMAALIIAGWLDIWMVYANSLIAGMAMAVQQPARQAMIPATVPKEALQNAVVLNSGTNNIGMAAGPAIAGFMVGAWGMAATFLFQAVLYAYSIVVTQHMSARAAAPSARPEKESVSRSMIEGFRYVMGNKVILALLVLGLVPIAFGNPFQSMLPMFVDEILGAGPEAVGILMGALGVGSIFCVLVLAFFPIIQNTGRIVIISSSLFGLFVFLFSFSNVFWISVVLLFFAGISRSLYRTMNHTMLLQKTERAYLGRVNSIYLMDRGLMPLGTVMIGLLAEFTQVALAIAIMSFLCIFLSLGTLLLSTALWQTDRKTKEISSP